MQNCRKLDSKDPQHHTSAWHHFLILSTHFDRALTRERVRGEEKKSERESGELGELTGLGTRERMGQAGAEKTAGGRKHWRGNKE